MYLVDTNVFSETRRRVVDAGVRKWFDAVRSDDLYMSAITDLELERGMLMQRRRDPAQSAALATWIGSVRAGVVGRVLDVTVEIARVCAAIQIPDRRPLGDALIAATALHHGLTVVTRNEKDFDVPGLQVVNPFTGAE